MGAHIMLLYRDFYDKHLSHIPLRKLEELEIWGIGVAKCPYDGYIPIWISFRPAAVGKVEAFDALAVVCPRPPRAGQNSILVGTNTDLVRRLLCSVLTEEGSVKSPIDPQLLKAYRRVAREKKAPEEGVGWLWRLETEDKVTDYRTLNRHTIPDQYTTPRI